MGCGSSKAVSAAVTTTTTNSGVTDFTVVAQQVKQTWPDVKKINKLGVKAFAHLLYKYPELKGLYHVPEAYKTEVDLLNCEEIEEPSNKFIILYSDIVDNSLTKLDETIHQKATELYRQGVRIAQIKYYGESLVHVIQYELRNELNVEETQAWQVFSTEISRRLSMEMSKFPRRSIV